MVAYTTIDVFRVSFIGGVVNGLGSGGGGLRMMVGSFGGEGDGGGLRMMGGSFGGDGDGGGLMGGSFGGGGNPIWFPN